MDFDTRGVVYLCTLGVFLMNVVSGLTNPNDFKILNDFKNGLENPELLQWPSTGNDPCGPPAWPHLFCFGDRITQIQVERLGLKGSLPQNLNELHKLQNLVLDKNNFSGKLPTLSGLSDLKYVYLDGNQFDTIPADFFNGLSTVQVLVLDLNPLNKSGWSIPIELQNATQLAIFSCIQCNIVGSVPNYFGKFQFLTTLKLSRNHLIGNIPETFRGSKLQILWLNNQDSTRMTGSIDIVGTMHQLTSLFLQSNNFSGPIPNTLGDLNSLKDISLSKNQLIGLIPQGLVKINLSMLDLSDNMLMGPIPKFRAANATYASNSFCQSTPGVPCAPQVNTLLDLLGGWNYPVNLALKWLGNDPCIGLWLGISCNSKGRVTIINLENKNLTGMLRPSLANMDSLVEVHLKGNSLHGPVPANLTELKFLKLLDLSGNDFDPPLPKFRDSVKINTDGNARLIAKKTVAATKVIIITVCVVFVVLVLASFLFFINKKNREDSIVIGLEDPEMCTAKSENLVLSIQNLRRVINNFATENELGRGGFGTVYKGVTEDGIQIAVKRMEPVVINCKALDEFQAEIDVLSKVRHRHLVSLLGYSIEGNEKLLVYEYMSKGPLSRHLFQWESLNLRPLSWKQRLNIALDVARGMDYLHNMACHSFIHRDLKSSNILLDDDFRAKVSDFGLAKLVPDKERSVATRLAGTFGYLAPEYAVTGKVTTKIDVFSFGVVLMELVAGLTALDEHRSEETRYLVEWFWKIKSSKESLFASIDPALDAKEDIHDSIYTMAELAGHCTLRDPNRRPDMTHAVNVIGQLVESWKPVEESDEHSEIVCPPLLEMLKNWQEKDLDTRHYSVTN